MAKLADNDGSGPTVRVVAPAVAALMLQQVVKQTPDSLTAQFGISYNTWRKIKSGQPIRASVADRLERRVAGDVVAEQVA